MFKYKAVKLAVVSILSASALQAIGADFPTSDGNAIATTEQQSRTWIDFSDPTAIYSKVGLATGTEGVDVYAALGGYLGGQFEQKLTFEVMHDNDYYNVNYLAFNTTSDTGFSIDTRWDNNYNVAAVGVIKKLQLDQVEHLNIYPAMKFGFMWDWDNSVKSTTFVELGVTARYSVNRNFWVGATPTYQYALNGENIRDLAATADVGYQLAEEVAVSAHANTDDEIWADFTFAF